MPQKTKTEYETVEKKIKYTECDVPGCFHTDEEYAIVELAVNPQYESVTWQEPTVIQQVDDIGEAQEWVEKEEEKLRQKSIELNKVGGLGKRFGEMSYAYGYRHKENFKKAKADASFFVCASCLKNHFEIVPDRYSPENVEKIEGRKGGLYIEENTHPRFEININDWVLFFIGFIFANILYFILYLSLF